MDDKKIDVEYKSATGGFRITFRQEGDIVIAVSFGIMSGEDAEVVVKITQDYCAKIGKPFPHLIEIASLEHVDSDARRLFGKNFGGKDSPFSRLAAVGGNLLVRTIFNIHGKISKVPMKMFATRDEALSWLKAR